MTIPTENVICSAFEWNIAETTREESPRWGGAQRVEGRRLRLSNKALPYDKRFIIRQLLTPHS